MPHANPETGSRPTRIPRRLGTMVAYGFERGSVTTDLEIADRIGAKFLEILPDWIALPDPEAMGKLARDRGFTIHSVHGCWGSRKIAASRVDLGSTRPEVWQESVDDLKRCLDWLSSAQGTHLIVHPGGLTNVEDQPERSQSLRKGLVALADHVAGSDLVICVENMPSGVYPGSRMADLLAIVEELGRPEVGLVIDTGHANIVSTAFDETLAAGRWLRSTHVHDNNGRADTHEPPGAGTVDWSSWVDALDTIAYRGPVMLECIRALRQSPDLLDEPFLDRLAMLTR